MNGYPWFAFLIDLFAIFRLVRLITKDSLLNGPRWWILNRWPSELTTFPDALVVERRTVEGHTYGKLQTGIDVWLSSKVDNDGDPLWEADKTYKWTELLECPWCVSAYLAAIVVGLRNWIPQVWGYVAVILAFSALVGLISKHLDSD